MRVRNNKVNGKFIDIYDDWLPATDKLHIFKFLINSFYVPKRAPFSDSAQSIGTLEASYGLRDMLRLRIFENEFILNYIKENNLRIYRSYAVLVTASDTYMYHVDSDIEGTPTALYYANLEWKPEWEGETHFSDEKMQEVLFTSSFVPGRLVIFDGTIPHKSSQPAIGSSGYRFALAIKFAIQDEYSWKYSVNIQDFFYDKKFDNITVKEQEAIARLKTLCFNKQYKFHSEGSFFEHLYGVYCVLKSWGEREELCLAGLYHSAFGSEYYEESLNIEYNTLVEIIGKESSYLVQEFCRKGRDDNILQNIPNYSTSINLDLAKIMYANIIEQTWRVDWDYDEVVRVKNKIVELQQ